MTRPATFPAFALLITYLIILSGQAHADMLDDITTASDSAKAVALRALENEDAAQIAALFTDEGTVIDAYGRSVKGRFSIRVTLTMLLMATATPEVEIERSEIEINDSTGLEKGEYILKYPGKDGKIRTFKGDYDVVWKLEDGLWKIERATGAK